MEPSPSRSALRAAALIGLAVAAVLVAGVVYLRPSFRTPAAAATPPPPRPALGSAFFADADHGVVAVIPAGGSNSIATLFVTRDGGRTWSRELGGPASTILSGPLSGSRFLVVASTQPGPHPGGALGHPSVPRLFASALHPELGPRRPRGRVGPGRGLVPGGRRRRRLGRRLLR